MLTLDAVRTAVLSDQPWSRLDELVRAELTSGRTTRQIYKSLMEMADEIDATPGLPEDGSDAFGDVLDALTGFCRAEHQYKDPPNVTLPTEKEIAELPRWARVAFAARCARRVLPVFIDAWPILHRDQLRAVIAAADLAEAVATQGLLGGTAAGDALADAGNAASHASLDDRARAAGLAAAMAAAAASYLTAENAFAAAHHALLAVGEVSSIRSDFDHLARFAEAGRWDDNTPVPPEVFGPLWPKGPPKGWPAVTDAPQRTELVVEAFARERATEKMIEDDIVNLFNALNRYHIARRGTRLTLDQFRSLVSALVAVGV